jgi:hypothetical protein
MSQWIVAEALDPRRKARCCVVNSASTKACSRNIHTYYLERRHVRRLNKLCGPPPSSQQAV